MKIEVLICTHNRDVLLKKVLGFLNLTVIPKNSLITICVVANACTDNTHNLLDEYRKKQLIDKQLLPLVWYKVPKPGKSNALNYAISKLEGDLIVMVDDDHRIPEDFFKVLNSAFDKYKNDDVFFGKILPDWVGEEPEWAHETGKYAIYPLPVPCYDKGDASFEYSSDVALPGGGNLALKRNIFDLVGEFKTELGPSGHNLGGGEDSDYLRRAISMGVKLRYLPDMVQYHYVDLERFRLSYILTKSFQRSRTVNLAHKKNITKVPNYMWKKLTIYFFSSIFSLSLNKSRFYMVRMAAILGEISAYRRLSKESE